MTELSPPVRPEEESSDTPPRITALLHNMIKCCIINITLAAVIIITGTISVCLPNSFGRYTSAVAIFGHCFWVGGPTIVFSLFGILAYRNGQFSDLKPSIHVTLAGFNILAILGGFIALLLSLEVTLDMTKKVKPHTSKSVAMDIINVQVISIVIGVIIFVVYTSFMYANIRSVQIYQYRPKRLLSDRNNEIVHTVVIPL